MNFNFSVKAVSHTIHGANVLGLMDLYLSDCGNKQCKTPRKSTRERRQSSGCAHGVKRTTANFTDKAAWCPSGSKLIEAPPRHPAVHNRT